MPEVTPEVMQALGLDREVVERIQKERDQKLEAIKTSRANGASLYEFARNKPVTEIKLAGGTLEVPPTPLDELSEVIAQRTKSLEQQTGSAEPISQIKAFAEGLGDKALQDRNFKVAVPLLNYASPSGIVNNSEVVAKIKNLVGENPEELVTVAELIEETRRASVPEPAPATTPEPIPVTPTTPPPFEPIPTPNPSPTPPQSTEATPAATPAPAEIHKLYDVNEQGLRPVPAPKPQPQTPTEPKAA
ncbi:MAG: hypothetical protein NUV69_05540 [Candidatus Curtissbacteria bacterium]|nr:hypothetical protein [Candidatus Curtissbacteria bacterium]